MKTIPHANALSNISIGHEIINGLLSMTVADIDNPRIAKRLNNDNNFLLSATRMTNNILIAFTLAQTVAAEESFNEMIPVAPYSLGDNDLYTIGNTMIEKIRSAPPILDIDIPDALLQDRFEKVLAAV